MNEPMNEPMNDLVKTNRSQCGNNYAIIHQHKTIEAGIHFIQKVSILPHRARSYIRYCR